VAEADVALASILAAQLATLAMPLPAQLEVEPAKRAAV